MGRAILHIDMNSCYASIECLHHPEIRHLPVAVGGDVEARHGIILAKNELAKRAGVKTGEALWQAKQKCPDLVIVPPHYQLYLRFSRMARAIYAEYTDLIEPFGLDEAWIDVTGSGILGDAVEIAETIRKRVKFELGITVSIGVSFNKIFAKLGSDYKKPDAVTVFGKDDYREKVWPLPVEELLYAARTTTERRSGRCRWRNCYTWGRPPRENYVRGASERLAIWRGQTRRCSIAGWGRWATFSTPLPTATIPRR